MLKKSLFALVMTALLLVVVVLGYLQFFFCKDLPIAEIKPYILEQPPADLDVRFYGTACFYIGYHGSAVMTDPFFSNPSPFSMFFNLQADNSSVSAVSDTLWKNVKAFVIGHSHFDHCLELPAATEKTTGTTLIGNTTIPNLFGASLKNSTFVNADSSHQFVYTADSSIRIYPVLSHHSPHIGNIVLANGNVLSPVSVLPKNWLRWKCGNNYSFVIDFLEKDSIVRRVFVSGGDNTFPVTIEEKALVAEKQPDLIIMPFWDAKVMEDRIRRANTAFGNTTLVVSHWNNFFRSSAKSLQVIRKAKLNTALPEIQQIFPDMPLRIMLPEQTK